jgi:hypothetical protein
MNCASPRPFKHHEARPGDCGGKIEIHEPEPFADLEMLFWREGELAYGSMFADLAIGAFVAALGYFIERNIRNFRENLVELLAESAFPRFTFLDRALELLYLLLQPLSRRTVFLRHRLADFLRYGIALALRILKFLHLLAPLLVDCQYGARQGLKPAPGKTAVKGIGIVPDPFDIEHRCQASEFGVSGATYRRGAWRGKETSFASYAPSSSVRAIQHSLPPSGEERSEKPHPAATDFVDLVRTAGAGTTQCK